LNIAVRQNSKVIVKDYTLDKDNARKNADILLERGKARAVVAKMHKQADFIISTPNARGRVKGSDIINSAGEITALDELF